MVWVSSSVFLCPPCVPRYSPWVELSSCHLLSSPIPDPQGDSIQDHRPHLSFASLTANLMLVSGHLVSCSLWKTPTYLIFSVLLVATFLHHSTTSSSGFSGRWSPRQCIALLPHPLGLHCSSSLPLPTILIRSPRAKNPSFLWPSFPVFQ